MQWIKLTKCAASSRGADDGRLLLMSSINEYERYLSSIYER